MPTSQDFARELEHTLAHAEQQGLHSVWVTAGQLHRAVGGYPGPSHRMPMCCDVLRKEMTGTDRIIAQPPKGNGATLTINFKLPRHVVSSYSGMRSSKFLRPAAPVMPQVRTPATNAFRQALEDIFGEAERAGESWVEITSGDLHRWVGGYPGPHHRMPMCCAAMRAVLEQHDEVLAQPPKGNGATLIIAYALPRNGERRRWRRPVSHDIPVLQPPEPVRPQVGVLPPVLPEIETPTLRPPIPPDVVRVKILIPSTLTTPQPAPPLVITFPRTPPETPIPLPPLIPVQPEEKAAPELQPLTPDPGPILTWLDWFARHEANSKDPALEDALRQLGAARDYSFWSPDCLRKLDDYVLDVLTSSPDVSRQLRADVFQRMASYFIADPAFPHPEESRYGELYEHLVCGLAENQEITEHTSRILLSVAEAYLAHRPTTGCHFIFGQLEPWFNKPMRVLADYMLDACDLLVDYSLPAYELAHWYRKWIASLLDGSARLGVLDLKAWKSFGQRCSVGAYQLGRIEGALSTRKEQIRDDEGPLVLPKPGFRIVIFTLRPVNARHASELFGSLKPAPEVTICTDTVRTPRAVRLAESADLGVLVPWCTKHALTDGVKDLLKVKVFAKSPGSLAIARAVMDFLGDKAVS